MMDAVWGTLGGLLLGGAIYVLVLIARAAKRLE